MNKKQIQENIEMCRKAEKEILEPIEPFLAYWSIVEQAKKQVKILSRQRKYLEKQLKENDHIN